MYFLHVLTKTVLHSQWDYQKHGGKCTEVDWSLFIGLRSDL